MQNADTLLREARQGSADAVARLLALLPYPDAAQLCVPPDPWPGSQLHEELLDGRLGEAASQRHVQMELLLGSVRAHGELTCRALSDPPLAHATWSAFRATVEPASWFVWLLGTETTLEVRMARSILLTLEDIHQQHGVHKSLHLDGSSPASIQDLDDALQSKLDEALGSAEALGYVVERTKKRWRICDQTIPGKTQVSEMLLGRQADYRFASGVIHGMPYALKQTAGDYLPWIDARRRYEADPWDCIRTLQDLSGIVCRVIELRLEAYGLPNDMLRNLQSHAEACLDKAWSALYASGENG